MSEVSGQSTNPLGTNEDFATIFKESLLSSEKLEGTVIEGTVIAIENDAAVIDVGLKAEGRVPVKEFSAPGATIEIKVGDKVEVFLDRLENRNGEVALSRERARREEAWVQLEKAFGISNRVDGTIFGRVKGGYTVDLDGAVAFLPQSQVDVRPVRDIGPLMGNKQPFQILKMDRRRGNIVVSRRAVMEESRAEARAELLSGLKEGQILDGVVKNITDYGAFVDLGEVDGLLHVTDIAWRRISHPSESVSIGQAVKVQVIRFNLETERISLGMKQLEADPWDGVALKYPIEGKFNGRVTNITDYGAFVELEAGVEGLVHVSEMSWTKKNRHPGKILSTSEQVEVMVLDVNSEKRRISLGLKQCGVNPWEDISDLNPVGAVIEGEIKNVTEFGLFVGMPGNIDGLIHMTDLAWDKPGDEVVAGYRKGDTIKAKVLEIDIEKERISLGVKQLTEDPFVNAARALKKGQVVTCVVSAVLESGLEVTLSDGMKGQIRRADLARDRGDQRMERFSVGEKVDAKVTQVDKAGRKFSLSIKALEIEEEKRAMAEYGSASSGASLGEILGAAISEKEEANQKTDADGIEGISTDEDEVAAASSDSDGESNSEQD